MIVEDMTTGASDGRGEKKPISGAKVDPRYVYYRFYTTDGALESNNPIYSNDPFISRTLSKYVTPPHTAASLKKHLCWIEGFQEPIDCNLYLSLSEQTSVENSTRIQLRGKDQGPGLSEFEPVALVSGVSAVEKRSSAVSTVDSKELPKLQDEEHYVHYRVYNENGAVASKASFDETDFSLGRINVVSIAPPHTVASLKARLVKVEGVVDQDVKLFEDEGGDTIMEDSDPLNLLSETYPGIIEDAPMAFVHRSQKKISDTRPQDPLLGFSETLKATWGRNWADYDPVWHSAETGEVFRTNGVLKYEPYKPNNANDNLYEGYEAINSSGKRAFLQKRYVKFC